MRIALNNFTGGEVSESLKSRYDLSRYKNSVQCMENFLPTVHGTATRRPGTKFIADITTSAQDDAYVLYPFSFNVESDQNYVLILSDKRLRIAQSESILSSVNIVTPWGKDDLYDLSFAQVGDIVYFAHKNYPLHKLMRSGVYPYSWQVQQVALNVSLSAPRTPNVVFYEKEASDKTYTLRYKVCAVDEFGQQSLPSGAGSALGKHPSDWVLGDNVTISWSAVAGATEYNIYREEAGYFGFIGISTGTSFTDNNYQADISDTPKEDWNPFENDNNPSVVSFHQQRMVLGGTPNSPQAFYMSRIGDFESFRKSRPIQEDDPVEYLIASGNIDSIAWLASFGDLLIGTSGSEYKASGDGSSISSSNISITHQSSWGSSSLFPIVIGNSILHVQRHGARVRDLFYSLEKDGYAGNDLSIMAPHLFDTYSLKQWAFQQTPFSTIWIVRNDGVLLALTYMKEHDIWGWSRHNTEGRFLSCVTVSGDNGDEIYFTVEREINGSKKVYLEKLADRWLENEHISHAFLVDSGKKYISANPIDTIIGLEYLEGCRVSILADGSPIEGLTVQGGKIVLPYSTNTVIVGLPYTSRLSPLPTEGDLQTGTTLGQIRGIGKCSIRMLSTVGGSYGSNKNAEFDFPFIPSNFGEAVEPFTGDFEFIPNSSQSTSESVWIVQNRALPMTIGALVINLDI